METSVAPKKLPAFIIESTRRSFLLVSIPILNIITGSKYVLAMDKERFVIKKAQTQPGHLYTSHGFSMAGDKA